MKLIIPLIIIFLFTGCIEKKVKYYKNNDSEVLKPKIIATAHFSKTSSSNKSETFADLPEKALASLIKSYSENDETRKEFISLLAKPIKSRSSKSVDDSRVQFSRNFTFSLIDNDFNPADRIYSAHYKLELPTNWEFSNWRGFEIKDRSVNVAKTTNAQTRSFNLTGLYTPTHFAKFGESTSVFSNSNVKTINRGLDFELVEVMPIFKSNSLELFLRAPFPQVNLAGSYNFQVDINYASPPNYQEVLYFDIDKKEGDKPQHASVNGQLVKYITTNGDLTNGLYSHEETLLPVVRVVENKRGKKTLIEDDDKVKYLKIDTKMNPVKTLILNKKDFEFFVNQVFWNKKPVFFMSDINLDKKKHAKPLVLPSGQDSLKLKKWLQTNPKNISYTNKQGETWSFYTCDTNGELSILRNLTPDEIQNNFISEGKFMNTNDTKINRFCKTQ